MKALRHLELMQIHLEETYGAKTGLQVKEFVRSIAKLDKLGSLVVQTQNNSDLDLALLFDRDILAAFDSSATPSTRALSVTFEEVSHFVYLSFNHQRGRNVTQLEMEIQSEIDRVLLAFHGGPTTPAAQQNELLTELLEKSYSDADYEHARKTAAAFLRQLSGGDPRAWTPGDFTQLRKFFHSDLSEKLHLAKKPR